MAAGLGFKTFTTGEVLTADDVNGYLMQGVLVFASEAARDAAITSPQEGQFAFTKDNNSLWYYSGAAWVASGATGDIEGVTAGTGISGGGTSGTVTITNSMATEIDAKGDLVVGTGADIFARLAVGANGTVLTAASGEATGLEWAAPAGGGANYTLLNAGGTALTAASTITVSGITGIDSLLVVIDDASSANASSEMQIRFNSDTGSNYAYWGLRDSIQSPYDAGMLTSGRSPSATSFTVCKMANNAASLMQGAIEVTGCNASGIKIVDFSFAANQGGGLNNERRVQKGYYSGTSTISSVSIISSTGNWDSGTVYIYGSA
jgi:hypothetical protein